MDNMKKYPARLITEIGIAVALATVLNFLPLMPLMPQGGSVSLEMLPIFLIALRWGGKSGLLAVLVYGLVQLIVNPYIIHPIQLIMDYPLPYMFLGLTGFFNIMKKEGHSINYQKLFIAMLTGGVGRFITHLLSGVVFFGSYAPEGQSPWLYSAIYNGSYLLPSLILSYIIIGILLKKLVLRKDMR
jgi:thiamine transporter